VKTVELDRTLAAPVERVWHALTDPAALAMWFWPASFGTRTSVDLRPGGALRIEAPGRMAIHGEYVEIDPPHSLTFTWQWDGEDEVTTVRIVLSAVDGATRLTLRHEGFLDLAARDNHHIGWSDCLDRLPPYLG
jgi:uncharacterized protein YndB with AHSA1/START domain